MKTRLFSLLLTVVMLCGLFPVTVFASDVIASGNCGENLTWTLTENICDCGISYHDYTLTISGTGDMDDYAAFPHRIPWYDYQWQIAKLVIEDGVTSIGSSAFEHCITLRHVSLASSITSIGDFAFAYCDELSEIIIPLAVTSIGSCAFDNTALRTVSIPASVTDLHTNAFGDCDALTAISVAADNPFYTSADGILYNKAMTELIRCPGGKDGAVNIPDSVTVIGDFAFDGCSGLDAVTIPDEVESIGIYAFSDCVGLSEIALPNSVRELGTYALSGCTGLTSLTIPSGVTSLETRTFYRCDNLATIEVAGENTAYCSIDGLLYDKAVQTLIYCPGAKAGDITIPESVTEIHADALYSCKSLTGATLPDGLQALPDRAFDGCSALTDIVIPAGVTSIGDMAFYNCTSLTGVFFLGNAPILGSHAFEIYDSGYIPIPGMTLYYLEGKTGWTSPIWNGYPTAIWMPGGHVHSYTDVITAPTCSEEGYTTHTCTACGESYLDDFIDALGHDWNEGVVTLEPTETKAGEMTYTCNRCDEIKTEEILPLGVPEFTDVPNNAWYVEAVNYVVKNGLMYGVDDGIFRPEGTMTRAMLVTVLWRYEGEPIMGGCPFDDIQNEMWYTYAVGWAAVNGIVTGVEPTRFNPDGSITREQIAAVLFRYANYLGLDTSARDDLSSFPDADKVSPWALDAMQWCVSEGIFGGSNGSLLPQSNATRAQVAMILMRFIENVI